MSVHRLPESLALPLLLIGCAPDTGPPPFEPFAAEAEVLGVDVGELVAEGDGEAFADALDVLDDGRLLVGAPLWSDSELQPGAGLLHTTGSEEHEAGMVVAGELNDCFAGESLAGVGDVNGDGFSDFALGATCWRRDDEGQPGWVGLASGDPEATEAERWLDSWQGLPGDHMGWSMDRTEEGGLVSVVVGAPAYFSPADNGGSVTLLSIDDGTFSETARVEAISEIQQLGFSVSDVGDLDGDGLRDLVFGAPHTTYTGPARGAAYLWLGPHSGTVSADDVDARIDGGESAGQLGWLTAAAGDLNGDGLDDFVLAGPSGEREGADAGEAYVFCGGDEADTSDEAWATLWGPRDVVWGVDSVTPLEIGGAPALALGGVYGGREGEGRVWVFEGLEAGVHELETADRVFAGPHPGSRAGSALTVQAGDGGDILFVGAKLAELGSGGTGAVFAVEMP